MARSQLCHFMVRQSLFRKNYYLVCFTQPLALSFFYFTETAGVQLKNYLSLSVAQDRPANRRLKNVVLVLFNKFPQ